MADQSVQGSCPGSSPLEKQQLCVQRRELLSEVRGSGPFDKWESFSYM